MRMIARLVLPLCLATPVLGQSAFTTGDWNLRTRFELRANIRDSEETRFQLRFPFPSEALPVGETHGFLETVDDGTHAEVSLVTVQFDAQYRDVFAARAKVDGVDLYNRNPTSGDRQIDADELWLRFGHFAEGLELPAGTSVFIQVGKAPKMERQPVRLLESYGLAANAFNRFNDTQVMLGGSVGRNLYWRAQISNGNPLFFRDTNALAGDNGTDELLLPHPNPELKSGFPILYDAEVEDYFFDDDYLEQGYGLGYRWSNEAGTAGFDVLAYHYNRDLAPTVELDGTFYRGDIEILNGAFGIGLPITSDKKRETGGRVYAQWNGLSVIGQYVGQSVAGLERDGYELEAGWEFPIARGIRSIQPAVRYSKLDNHFRGPGTFVSPSVWWDWDKLDVGLRIGLPYKLDVTLEHSMHDIEAPAEVNLDESLLTVRLRI